MTSILATRAARRRGIVFVSLLTITVLLMAISSNPLVREIQNGISFAFRPLQVAFDEVARTASSVAGTVAEIDRLRVDNAALQAENDRLTAENARLAEIRRENESLTALLQLRAGLDFNTVASSVIDTLFKSPLGGSMSLTVARSPEPLAPVRPAFQTYALRT